MRGVLTGCKSMISVALHTNPNSVDGMVTRYLQILFSWHVVDKSYIDTTVCARRVAFVTTISHYATTRANTAKAGITTSSCNVGHETSIKQIQKKKTHYLYSALLFVIALHLRFEVCRNAADNGCSSAGRFLFNIVNCMDSVIVICPSIRLSTLRFVRAMLYDWVDK